MAGLAIIIMILGVLALLIVFLIAGLVVGAFYAVYTAVWRRWPRLTTFLI